MEIFRDRIDAGIKLANALAQWKGHPNALVIGLPRGGVPVANEVAKALHLPLDVICPRKIGAPNNKEFAIGAITETGEGIFSKEIIHSLGISEKYIAEEVEAEKKEAQKRIELFRQGKPPREVEGKMILLIDDGLATGATMKAAIRSLRREGAESIVVAVPVSPSDTLRSIRQLADEVVCLSSPPFFQAVGQFYEDFSSTEDEEVVEIMAASRLS